MYDNEYFVVDMAACLSTGEIINKLSLALETLNHSGKKIVLKLNDTYLNQSQMLSIQSLITSWGCTLDTIETLNPNTWATAENMNIFVQKPIEKRLEDDIRKDEADEHTIKDEKEEKVDDSITIKDVNGLHFEADLNTLKKKQDDIDIISDVKTADVDILKDIKAKEEYTVKKQDIDIDKPSQKNSEILAEKNKSPIVSDEDFDGNIKNTIGVYTKAYDDSDTNSDWEEVDFYESPTDEPVVSDTKSTTYINQTLRSGQILESEGNVVVIGDCHPGSEIRAVGDITVWGVLSGIAHAGYKGNVNSTVRALKMNAIQIRIANCYSRRPDSTNIPYIIHSSVFTPEEARIVDDNIVLFKVNQTKGAK